VGEKEEAVGSDLALAQGRFGGKSSFDFSFAFLPKEKREALKAVYAFCRTTDDIVDSPEIAGVNRRAELLRTWREELEQAFHGTSDYPVLNRLSQIARRFNIPVLLFYDLLRGVEMDLVKNRYESFAELEEYCTLVASYGRIYLPLEDLRRFRCPEADLLEGRCSPEFRELMEFETRRAEEYFRRARLLLPPEDRRAMFAPKIMERIYYHTLLRIKDAGYDVFDRRVQLPRILQFLIAVKYWVKQRLLGR
jgi:phytoene synthase